MSPASSPHSQLPLNVLHRWHILQERHKEELAELNRHHTATLGRHAVEQHGFWTQYQAIAPDSQASPPQSSALKPDFTTQRVKNKSKPTDPNLPASKTTAEIIDLTSDGETEPTASRTVESFPTSSSDSFKTAKETLERVQNQPQVKGENDRNKTRSLASPFTFTPRQHIKQPFNIGTSPQCARSRKKPLPLDKPTEFTVNQFLQQQEDYSRTQKTPVRVPRDQALLALQQQRKQGDFVGNILHNGRSQSWAPALGKIFEPLDEDTHMEDAPEEMAKRSLIIRLRFISTEARKEFAAKVNSGKKDTALPSLQYGLMSPPSSNGPGTPHDLNEDARSAILSSFQRSVTPKTPRNTPGPPAFKIPTLPTFGACATALHQKRNQRASSLASQVSNFSTLSKSTTPTAKKRKKVLDVSDESDYEPTPPSSPEASVQPAPTKPKTVFKKVKGANGFGFRPVTLTPQTPSSQGNNRATTAAPSTPKKQRTNFPYTQASPMSPSERAAQAKAQRSSTAAPSTAMQSLVTRRNIRATRLKAEASLKATNDEVLRQESLTEEQHMQELGELADTEDIEGVKGGMRGLSLTPSLGGGRRARPRGSVQEEPPVYTSEDWKKDRQHGDRWIAKRSVEMPGNEGEGGEEDAELDIRHTEVVDGVIVDKRTRFRRGVRK
ncbi:hypothetical protein BDV95DRAFT_179650 [Massariosphaeria phaeospora]|uniref:Uncharacterized protein n=1 Tax=Massariosphaeria phaeospora TaxID=100035 RepID=A0A7C8MEE5_9PLEO|nr:hypothetical protein BDV95DRAFT_179650 [Massariosphaeria phaeospora]